MTLNPTLVKIEEMYKQKNWTMYRLAKESAIPYSSLNNLFRRNNQPTISTMERICDGLGISMNEFFDSNLPSTDFQHNLHLSEDEYILIETYRKLSEKKKSLLTAYMDGLKEK